MGIKTIKNSGGGHCCSMSLLFNENFWIKRFKAVFIESMVFQFVCTDISGKNKNQINHPVQPDTDSTKDVVQQVLLVC